MVRPHVVCLEETNREYLGKCNIHTAAEKDTHAVGTVGNILDRKAVVARKAVQEEIHTLVAPHEARTTGDGGVIVAALRAISEVDFEAPVRVNVVSQSAANAFCHIRHEKRRWVTGITKRSWRRYVGVQPLISGEDIPLGS